MGTVRWRSPGTTASPTVTRIVPTGNNRFIDTSRLPQPNSGHDWTPP
jgi:hypothetical protein